MRSQNKSLLAIASGLLGVLLTLLLSAKLIVLQSFRAIEGDRAREHLLRVVGAIDNELDYLAVSVGDYAAWDETYRFVQDGNAGYAEANLAEASLARLRVDLVAFVRTTGELVYAKAVDSETAKSVPVPQGLERYLTPSSPLVRLKSPESSGKGILLLDGTPVLVVAKPVLTSSGRGPIQGTLIMGRFIDAAETARLAKLTRLTLEISGCDPATVDSAPFKGIQPLSLDDPLRIMRPDGETLTGFALLGDLDRRPGLLVKATLPRQIYRQGVETIRYFMLWSVLIALLAIFASSRLLGRLSNSRRRREVAECLSAAVVEFSPVAVVLLDAGSCRVLQATPVFSLLLGYTPERLEGVLFRELLAGDRQAFERCREVALREGKMTGPEELRLLHNDRSVVVAEVNAIGTMLDEQQILCLMLRAGTGPRGPGA